MAPEIRLVPMDNAAFDRLMARLVPEYAAEKVEAGNWPEEGSIERAEAETGKLLPRGLETPDHWLWTIRESSGPSGSPDEGQDVGIMWVARREPESPELFIYDIEVLANARGRGVGRAALEALEAWARAEGFRSIGLHVFGSNGVARRLYQRLGYAETNVMMRKDLDPAPPQTTPAS
jgi:ribosomal protein S18 acetylase RimI-like enzyme